MRHVTRASRCGVKGVVIYKVGDDHVSIANAARRFLDQQSRWTTRVHNVFAGHLRAIVGGLTVEEMIRDRERLTGETRAAVRLRDGEARPDHRLAADPGDHGPDRLHQEPGRPARRRRPARRPHRGRRRRPGGHRGGAGGDRPQGRGRRATPVSSRPVTRPRWTRRRPRALQAGPLAEAASRQEVVVQETKVAELEAHRKEQQLQVEVRKPADARAYETVTLAEAERDARISAAEAQAQETELKAVAEANRVKIAALAEAEATKARGLATAESTRATGQAEAASRRGQGSGGSRRSCTRWSPHSDWYSK